jgi:hypothetical protein
MGRLLGRSSDQSGQTLIEFAVVLPVFMLMVFALVDGGRLVYTNAALSQAAREGARVAAAEAGWVGVPGSGCVSDASAIGASNPGAHVCPSDVAALASHVTEAANRMTAAVGPVTSVYLSCNEGDAYDPAPTGEWTSTSGGNGCASAYGAAASAAGELVSVRVEYTYEPFTPIVGSILGALDLSASSSMTIH